MINGPFTLAAAISGVIAFALAYTGLDVARGPDPLVLTVERLEYNAADRTVTQQLDGNIKAYWAARITRIQDGVSRELCAGEGDAPGFYTGTVSTWTVDDWAGDNCPPLRAGDIGVAWWTYENEFGFPVATSACFVVGRVAEDCESRAQAQNTASDNAYLEGLKSSGG